MAARKKAATTAKPAVEEIQKANVTVQPPGHNPRFALLGGKSVVNDIALYEKRGQYGLFYEMYKQHPVVRAAIDRKANFASAGGFAYVSSNPQETQKVDKDKEKELRRFFKESKYRQLLRMTYKDLDIYGESFWLIVLNLNNRPFKAMRLNPRYMNPVIVGGEVVTWKYGPVMQSDDAIPYPAHLVMHFVLDDPESDVNGISPLYALQRAVAQDIFAMEYNESFFKNAAQTGTIFIAKTADANEAARAREWIEANYTGPENAHRPLFVEGDVDVKKSVSTRVEMEYMQGREFLRQEIAMVLEVDLEKLGIHAGGNRAVSREQDEAFSQEAIWPRQITIEDEINWVLINKLYGWDDIAVTHSESDLRRKTEIVNIWDQHQKAGRMSIDDVLAEMGRPPLPGGIGKHYTMLTPAGVLTLEQIIKASEDSLAQTPAEPQSGQGTDQFGKPNPPSASVKDNLSPSQMTDSQNGFRPNKGK